MSPPHLAPVTLYAAKELNERNLIVGRVVYINLYQCSKGIICDIKGKQKLSSIENINNVAVNGGEAVFDIVFFDGYRNRNIPEYILKTGVQWEIKNEFVSTEIIAMLIGFADKREKEEQEQKEKIALEFDQAVEELRNNPEY
ncbi:hypothetical protein [Xenorhabdus vietnamensis]|uniref:hypothetical protein n=1 Tax=Xenorhabdus vietnamensis TaxID=351656 RepID=UPI00142E2C0D|nr:hypothetical protein [Xenorhabdus vietnamensis]